MMAVIVLGDKAISVRVAVMSGNEMEESSTGTAVDVRNINKL